MTVTNRWSSEVIADVLTRHILRELDALKTVHDLLLLSKSFRRTSRLIHPL
jgi:hypothetical protein